MKGYGDDGNSCCNFAHSLYYMFRCVRNFRTFTRLPGTLHLPPYTVLLYGIGTSACTNTLTMATTAPEQCSSHYTCIQMLRKRQR
jgi:hypothetical protein